MLCHKCISGYYKKYPSSLCSLHKEAVDDIDIPEAAAQAYNDVLRQWHENCFMATYITDKTVIIDDAIDAWHNDSLASKLKLHVYLGMNEYEYALFLKDETAALELASKRWKNKG